MRTQLISSLFFLVLICFFSNSVLASGDGPKCSVIVGGAITEKPQETKPWGNLQNLKGKLSNLEVKKGEQDSSLRLYVEVLVNGFKDPEKKLINFKQKISSLSFEDVAEGSFNIQTIQLNGKPRLRVSFKFKEGLQSLLDKWNEFETAIGSEATVTIYKVGAAIYDKEKKIDIKNYRPEPMPINKKIEGLIFDSMDILNSRPGLIQDRFVEPGRSYVVMSKKIYSKVKTGIKEFEFDLNIIAENPEKFRQLKRLLIAIENGTANVVIKHEPSSAIRKNRVEDAGFFIMGYSQYGRWRRVVSRLPKGDITLKSPEIEGSLWVGSKLWEEPKANSVSKPEEKKIDYSSFYDPNLRVTDQEPVVILIESSHPVEEDDYSNETIGNSKPTPRGIQNLIASAGSGNNNKSSAGPKENEVVDSTGPISEKDREQINKLVRSKEGGQSLALLLKSVGVGISSSYGLEKLLFGVINKLNFSSYDREYLTNIVSKEEFSPLSGKSIKDKRVIKTRRLYNNYLKIIYNRYISGHFPLILTVEGNTLSPSHIFFLAKTIIRLEVRKDSPEYTDWEGVELVHSAELIERLSELNDVAIYIAGGLKGKLESLIEVLSDFTGDTELGIDLLDKLNKIKIKEHDGSVLVKVGTDGKSKQRFAEALTLIYSSAQLKINKLPALSGKLVTPEEVLKLFDALNIARP